MSQLVIDSTIQQKMYKLGEYETCLYRSGEQNTEKIPYMVPGRAYSLVNWRYALEECGEHFDCLAPDLIGFGDSGHPEPTPGSRFEWIRIWKQQVIALLDELKIEKINVVGNSLGCQIAFRTPT